VHELSICASIADIATRHAAGRPVSVINVRVGQLRQIVPDTLVYCWGLLCEETSLAGSRIIVETVPARIRCRSCERTADVGDLPVFACGGCGGIDVEIVAGEEFLITSLELADTDTGAGAGADTEAGAGAGAGPETEAGAETGTEVGI
jgi:hydrogenase nickel incorporation protein HypA/HybF